MIQNMLNYTVGGIDPAIAFDSGKESFRIISINIVIM